MDLWAYILFRIFKVSSLNYALVGRLVLYIFKGVIYHKSIASSHAVRGEAVFGWGVHYIIGILLAFLMLFIFGKSTLIEPNLMLILLFAVCTTGLPLFVMQPAMGMGVAATKAPEPNRARLRSLQAHVSFGIGLYVSILLVNPTTY